MKEAGFLPTSLKWPVKIWITSGQARLRIRTTEAPLKDFWKLILTIFHISVFQIYRSTLPYQLCGGDLFILRPTGSLTKVSWTSSLSPRIKIPWNSGDNMQVKNGISFLSISWKKLVVGNRARKMKGMAWR